MSTIVFYYLIESPQYQKKLTFGTFRHFCFRFCSCHHSDHCLLKIGHELQDVNDNEVPLFLSFHFFFIYPLVYIFKCLWLSKMYAAPLGFMLYEIILENLLMKAKGSRWLTYWLSLRLQVLRE